MSPTNFFLLITYIFILNLTVTYRASCEEAVPNVVDISTPSPLSNSLKNTSLGGPCNISDRRPCKIRGAFCINGTCSCDPYNAIADVSTNKCLRKALRLGVRGLCKKDVQCSAELSSNSECGANNTCICKEGSVPNTDGTECLIGDRFPGEHCSKSKDCLGYPDKSECINDKCQCRGGYLPASKNNSETIEDKSVGCLPIVNRAGQKCVEGQQCQQGALGEFSECFRYSNKNQVCDCTKDAMLFETNSRISSFMELKTCYKIAVNVGDPCKIDQQCKLKLGFNAICSTDNRCICNVTLANGAKLLDNSCLQIIDRIGGDCENDQQCQQGTLGQLSTCTYILSNASRRYGYNIACQCKKNAVGVPLVEGESDICLKKAEVVGDSCTHDQQCNAKLGDLSECSASGRCVCKNSSTPSADGANCTTFAG